jgi:hypothetical protein
MYSFNFNHSEFINIYKIHFKMQGLHFYNWLVGLFCFLNEFGDKMSLNNEKK